MASNYKLFYSQDFVRFAVDSDTLSKCGLLKKILTNNNHAEHPIVPIPWCILQYALDYISNKIFKTIPDECDIPKVLELLEYSAE